MRIQSLDFTAKCIKDWHGHVQWHTIHWVRSQTWHDSGPRFCLCTGTTATLIFCNVIFHTNPFFPFGAMAADTENSHLEKDRKKTRGRICIFTLPLLPYPGSHKCWWVLFSFLEITFVQVLPFYLFSRLLVFLITSWEMKTDTLKKSYNLWHF